VTLLAPTPQLSDLTDQKQVSSLQRYLDDVYDRLTSSTVYVPTSVRGREHRNGDLFTENGGATMFVGGEYKDVAFVEPGEAGPVETPTAVFDVERYFRKEFTPRGDTEAIFAAVRAASLAGGGYVLLSAGTYRLLKKLALPTNVFLVGAGMDVTVIDARTLSDQAIVASGSVGPTVALAVDAAEGANSVVITLVAWALDYFAQNDWVFVGVPVSGVAATTLFSSTAGAANSPRLGMVCKIKDVTVAGTATLILDQKVMTNNRLTGDYLIADNALVRKVNFAENIGVCSLTLLARDSNSGDANGLFFDWCRKVVIDRVRVTNSKDYAIRFKNCTQVGVHKSIIEESPSTDETDVAGASRRYGMSIDGAGRTYRIVDTDFFKYRHQITSLAASAMGVPRDIIISNMGSYSARDAAIDSNVGWWDVGIINSKFVNSEARFSADGANANVLAAEYTPFVEFLSNELGAFEGSALQVTEGINLNISHNDVYGGGDVFLDVTGPIGKLLLQSNSLENIDGLFRMSAGTGDFVDISMNEIDDFDDPCVLVQNTADLTALHVMDNFFKDNNATATADVAQINNGGNVDVMKFIGNTCVDILGAARIIHVPNATPGVIGDLISRDNQYSNCSRRAPTTESHLGGTRVVVCDDSGALGTAASHIPILLALDDAVIVTIKLNPTGAPGNTIDVDIQKNGVSVLTGVQTIGINLTGGGAGAWVDISAQITDRTVALGDRLVLEISNTVAAGSCQALGCELNMARVYTTGGLV
jgi:hypothetical protein